jgi:hypothetical protein
MICRTTKIFWSILAAVALATTAAFAQWPRNLDDDYVSENKATALHGKSAPRSDLDRAPKAAPTRPVDGKPDAILALDTRKLMEMEGHIVTVEGIVVSTYLSPSSGARIFNFDPNRERFSFVIFSSAAERFVETVGEPTEFYLRKKVQITGVVTMHQGKPSMVVSRPDQIVWVK